LLCHQEDCKTCEPPSAKTTVDPPLIQQKKLDKQTCKNTERICHKIITINKLDLRNTKWHTAGAEPSPLFINLSNVQGSEIGPTFLHYFRELLKTCI